MAKTKYQETAVKYAEDYLERVLKMEDLGCRLLLDKHKRINYSSQLFFFLM